MEQPLPQSRREVKTPGAQLHSAEAMTLAHHIVAVGYVVTRDVPGDCIGSGNPARIVRQGIDAGWLGRLLEAHINQRLMHAREAIKLRLAKRGPVALDATYDTDD